MKFKAPEAFDELTRTRRQLDVIEIHARLLHEHLSEVVTGSDGSVIEKVNSRFTPEEGFAV